MLTVYHVSAGKYEQEEDGSYEKNCKYACSFFTKDEAMEAYRQVRDYPWVEVTVCTYECINTEYLA